MEQRPPQSFRTQEATSTDWSSTVAPIISIGRRPLISFARTSTAVRSSPCTPLTGLHKAATSPLMGFAIISIFPMDAMASSIDRRWTEPTSLWSCQRVQHPPSASWFTICSSIPGRKNSIGATCNHSVGQTSMVRNKRSCSPRRTTSTISIWILSTAGSIGLPPRVFEMAAPCAPRESRWQPSGVIGGGRSHRPRTCSRSRPRQDVFHGCVEHGSKELRLDDSHRQSGR